MVGFLLHVGGARWRWEVEAAMGMRAVVEERSNGLRKERTYGVLITVFSKSAS